MISNLLYDLFSISPTQTKVCFATNESATKIRPVFQPLLHCFYRIHRPSLQHRCFHFHVRVCVKLPFRKNYGQFSPSFPQSSNSGCGIFKSILYIITTQNITTSLSFQATRSSVKGSTRKLVSKNIT